MLLYQTFDLGSGPHICIYPQPHLTLLILYTLLLSAEITSVHYHAKLLIESRASRMQGEHSTNRTTPMCP